MTQTRKRKQNELYNPSDVTSEYGIDFLMGTVIETIEKRLTQFNYRFRQDIASTSKITERKVYDLNGAEVFTIFKHKFETNAIDKDIFDVILKIFREANFNNSQIFPKITAPDEATKKLWMEACGKNNYPVTCVHLAGEEPKPATTPKFGR